MVDAKKMKAWAGKDDDGKGGKDGADADEQSKDQGETGDEESQGGSKYEDLLPVLEEHAGDIEDAASLVEIAPEDVLSAQEPDPTAIEQAMDGFGELEQDAQDALSEHLSDLGNDDYDAIAQHLLDGGMIDDKPLVEAWLCLVTHGLKAAADSDEDENADDAGDDESDSDDANENVQD